MSDPSRQNDKTYFAIGGALPSPFVSLSSLESLLEHGSEEAGENLVFVLDPAEAKRLKVRPRQTAEALSSRFQGEMILFLLSEKDASLFEAEYENFSVEIRLFSKLGFILNELESECAAFFKNDGVLPFSLLGNDDDFLLPSFRKLLPLLHPLEKKERFYYLSSELVSGRLEIPFSLGLCEKSPSPIEGGVFVIASAEETKIPSLVRKAKRLHPKAVYVYGDAPEGTLSLSFEDCLLRFAKRDHEDEECLQIAYRFLSAYQENLDDFALPPKQIKMPLSMRYAHPWQYYGVGASLLSYRYSLTPCQERLSFGKEDAYRFLLSHYEGDSLLHKLAAHQHDLWTLRTLMNREDVLTAKIGLLIAFDRLVKQEADQSGGLSLKERFAQDKVYPDFLVPFAFLFAIARGGE